MIRFIAMILVAIIFCIISIPTYLVEFIIGKINPQAKVKSSQYIICLFFKSIIFISGSDITIKGLENVPKDVPVLYVGNHRGIFDVLIGYTVVKNNTGFIAKKELEKIPFVSWWMSIINCLFLDRKDIKAGLKTILKAIDLVKNGTSIFIFPEGTRSSGDEMLPFKEGSLKIAEKSGCPIIPVAITNTEHIFEEHFPKVKPAKVIFEFGAPIALNELDKEAKKHSGAYVQSVIAGMLEKNSKLL